MSTFRVASWLGFVVALGACGGSPSVPADASTDAGSARDSADSDGAPDFTHPNVAAESIAEVLCRLWTETCDCPRNPFGPYEQCVGNASAQLRMEFARAASAGLTYAPECVGVVIETLREQVGCKTRTELGALARELTAPTCKLFHGDAPASASCRSLEVAQGDSCQPGLRCVGVCQPVAPIAAIGEPCAPALCVHGAVCERADDAAAEFVCRPAPDLGEPCRSVCTGELVCDPELRVCAEAPGPGEPCGHIEPRCRRGARCDHLAERCVAATPEGAQCDDWEECGAGFECREFEDGSDRCGAEAPAVCVG